MYKYLSSLCAVLGIVLFFYVLFFNTAAWLSLLILIIGCIFGAASLKNEANSYGKIALVINSIMFLVIFGGVLGNLFTLIRLN